MLPTPVALEEDNDPQQEYKNLQALRHMIVKKAHPFIENRGWCLQAFQEASLAHHSDMPPFSFEALFPRGIKDALAIHHQQMDQRMAFLFQKKLSCEEATPAVTKVREKIEWLVYYRLQALHETKQIARQGAHFLKLPQNWPLAKQMIGGTVHYMWVLAGDTATDYNFYTKRALLGTVYAHVLAHWLYANPSDLDCIKQMIAQDIGKVMRLHQGISFIKNPWAFRGR